MGRIVVCEALFDALFYLFIVESLNLFLSVGLGNGFSLWNRTTMTGTEYFMSFLDIKIHSVI